MFFWDKCSWKCGVFLVLSDLKFFLLRFGDFSGMESMLFFEHRLEGRSSPSFRLFDFKNANVNKHLNGHCSQKNVFPFPVRDTVEQTNMCFFPKIYVFS